MIAERSRGKHVMEFFAMASVSGVSDKARIIHNYPVSCGLTGIYQGFPTRFDRLYSPQIENHKLLENPGKPSISMGDLRMPNDQA